VSDAFIYEAIRTPRGKLKGGSLTAVKPTDLVVGLIDEIKDRNPNLDPGAVDDIVLGVVSPVGEQGADIARTASIVAGLPDTVAGVQINRFCASGLEATNMAAQKVGSGLGDDLVLAGGVESMSRVPMGSDFGALFYDPQYSYDNYIAPQGEGVGRGPLRQVGRAGQGSERPRRARQRRAPSPRHLRRRPRQASPRLHRDR
jgi:acetyl-CoA C-acetyltransferase